MRKSLTEIANAHGTDKGTMGPSISCGAHNYTDIYEAYFCRNRDQEVALLEIGLGVRGPRWDARIVHGKNSEGAPRLRCGENISHVRACLESTSMMVDILLQR